MNESVIFSKTLNELLQPPENHPLFDGLGFSTAILLTWLHWRKIIIAASTFEKRHHPR
jgi:hypothetical protein